MDCFGVQTGCLCPTTYLQVTYKVLHKACTSASFGVGTADGWASRWGRSYQAWEGGMGLGADGELVQEEGTQGGGNGHGRW